MDGDWAGFSFNPFVAYHEAQVVTNLFMLENLKQSISGSLARELQPLILTTQARPGQDRVDREMCSISFGKFLSGFFREGFLEVREASSSLPEVMTKGVYNKHKIFVFAELAKS